MGFNDELTLDQTWQWESHRSNDEFSIAFLDYNGVKDPKHSKTTHAKIQGSTSQTLAGFLAGISSCPKL